MEVVQKLNTSARYVYDKILESVQYDIKEQTGQSLSPSELLGYEYKKSFSNNMHAKIEIVALEDEKKYQFLTKTNRNIFDALYEIEAIDEKNCQVRYLETMTSIGIIQKMNDMMIGILLGILKKKRIKSLLLEIERTANLSSEQQNLN